MQNISCGFNSIFRNELEKANIYFAFSLSFISVTYSGDILQFNLKKLFDLDLKKLGPPSWARINLMILVDLDLKSARTTLLEFELNLCYIGVGL